VIEENVIIERSTFPYIPGLLAYREGPALIRAGEMLKSRIDLLLVDGQGIAHPRGAGIAGMIGLLLNLPSIGCAKTKLVGDYRQPAWSKGKMSKLTYQGRPVGMALRSRDNVSPLFISVGFGLELRHAVSLVLDMCGKFRLPEPLRRAHILADMTRVGAMKQGLNQREDCSSSNFRA